MSVEFNVWHTATGVFKVAADQDIKAVDLKDFNRGKSKEDAIWVASSDVVRSPLLTFEAVPVLRIVADTPDGKLREVTFAIFPAHIYAIQSYYVSS